MFPQFRARFCALAAALILLPGFAGAADKLGAYELVHISSLDFDAAAAEIEARFKASALDLHATHDLYVPGGEQQARIFVLTSPALLAATAAEPPETVSSVIMRVAVYTHGEADGTLVNMANPVVQAMIFHAESGRYEAILEGARQAARQVRDTLASLPGKAVSEQRPPLRTEKHYNRYKGDGPARMMAKFRNWKKSQLVISEHSGDAFSSIVANIADKLSPGLDTAADDPSRWRRIAMIPVGNDAVYFGISNRFTENKMVGINSAYRKDGKTETHPSPGVDHAAALPLDVLVVRSGNKTRVLHYGQMWRMQLYFWDSGYRAFTANTGTPGKISDAVEAWLSP